MAVDIEFTEAVPNAALRSRRLVRLSERLADAAGSPQSESWVAAQEALTAAIAARGPTSNALAEIDALGATKLQAQAGLAPNDLAAIRSAGGDVGEIDQRQADAIKAIQKRLGL